MFLIAGASIMHHSYLMRLLLTILAMHVLSAQAFDVEDCPGSCHCTMDGLLMMVDCSRLELTELPTFPDNQVRFIRKFA